MALNEVLPNRIQKLNLEDSIENSLLSRNHIYENLKEELDAFPTYDSVLSSANMENRFSKEKSISPLKYLAIIQRAKEEQIPIKQVYEDLEEYF